MAIGDKLARQKFIEANLRLVINIANVYSGKGVDFMDLVDEGNIGLIKATDNFDVTRGYKFSTYATWWIKQAMIKSLYNSSQPIRLPVSAGGKIYGYRKMKSALENQENHSLTISEISKLSGMDIKQIEEYEIMSLESVSLDSPLINSNLNGDSTLGEFIEDAEQISVDDEVIRKMQRNKYIEIGSELPDKEKYLFFERLFSEKPKSLKEIGEKFAISKEGARVMERTMIKK